MNYLESKKMLNDIKAKYSCKGDIIFTTAVQMVIECGKDSFASTTWFEETMREVDNRHDKAESEGKTLFMTRDFEKAIFNCAQEIANINSHDLMVYIQREMYLHSGVMDGEPDYQRAIQIIRNCLWYTADNYAAYDDDYTGTLNKFRDMELTDDEIAYFGWEYYLEAENEEDAE